MPPLGPVEVHFVSAAAGPPSSMAAVAAAIVMVFVAIVLWPVSMTSDTHPGPRPYARG